MNESSYRNRKRFIVLTIFGIYLVGGLIAIAASYRDESLGAANKVAVILLGFVIIGSLAAYVMTQRVQVGPHSVAQASFFGRREMPYRSIERIHLERIMTRSGPVELMKLWTREEKLILTSSVEGFETFTRDILSRCPQAVVQDLRRRR